MHRLTSVLLLGGAVLLTSYVNAPAVLTPAPSPVSPADLAGIDAVAPLADDVAQQAERLRARLAAAPETPVTRRDPFSFGPRLPPVPSPDAAGEPPMPAVQTDPVIEWPTLVALLTDGGDPEARTSVLGMDEGIEILKAGETIGGFLVREITVTSVEIEHVATSTVTRLSIR